MRRPKESKTAGDDELGELTRRAFAENGAFSSAALREPTLAALERRARTVISAFPSTAHREPILRLLASQSER